MRWGRLILSIAGLCLAVGTLDAQIPLQAQADIAMQQITTAVGQSRPAEALDAITRYRKLGVNVPPKIMFVEAKLAAIMKDHARALTALSEYLRAAPNSDPSYAEAVRIFPDVEKAAGDAAERMNAEKRRVAAQAYLTQKPLVPFRLCEECPEMIKMPHEPLSVLKSNTSQEPPHVITFAKPFSIGQFEVTRKEWNRCVTDKACTSYEDKKNDNADDRPILGINYDRAQAYITWLNKVSGLKFRLPSWSEWEFAARAKHSYRYYVTDNLNEVCKYGNFGVIPDYVSDSRKWNNKNRSDPKRKYYEDHIDCTDNSWIYAMTKVGSFLPNNYGLYDIIGNAGEILKDCAVKSLSQIPVDGSAYSDQTSCNEHMRGGEDASYSDSYAISSWNIDFNLRYRVTQPDQIDDTGLRLAM